MILSDFLKEIKSNFKKHFPESTATAQLSTDLYNSLFVKYYLIKDKSEAHNRITLNDLFDVCFHIDTVNGALPPAVKLESDLDELLKCKLVLEVLNKSYLLKTEHKYLAYGRRTLPFRKTTGTPAEILKKLDKYAEVLAEQLKADFLAGLTPPDFNEIIKIKLER